MNLPGIWKRLNRWSGAHPIQRAGTLGLVAAGVCFAYWFLDERPSDWAMLRMLRESPGCLIGSCHEPAAAAWAARLAAVGGVLRFAAMPLIRWLRDGSSSSD